MTTQLDALGQSLAGLDVTRARIDVLSRNIANAQTDGYSEKTSSQTTGPLGQVFLGAVSRNVDQQLQASLNDTSGQVNQLNVQVNLLQQIETAFGSPTADTSLAAAITGLQNAFQNLSVNPEQTSLYSSALDAAHTVAANLNSLSRTVSTTNTQATIQIQQSVTSANDTLQQIDKINKEIVAQTGASDITDLEDQRDRLVSTLGGMMDIKVFARPNGGIAVYTADGKPLVDFTAATISSNGSQIIWNAPGSTSAPIKISSGTLGGLQILETQTLPAVQAQLDDVARALTVEFNNINIPLFNDGGGTPLNGTNPALPISVGNPPDPVQLVGYADRIAVNSTVLATPTILRDANSATPLAPGDTTNINQALQLFNRTNIAFTASTGLPASGSFVSVTTDFIAAQSALRANAQASLSSEQALQQTIQNKISAQSGVNVDNEVAQLAVLQNAYSANARVMQTSRDLFNTLFAAMNA
jgi:flagellar hook-associated protein 1 FlgK